MGQTPLQAIKLKGHIGPDQKVEIIESPIELPEGNVELIVLYSQPEAHKTPKRPSPLKWPTLNGGRYLGGALRREEIYSDDGR
jgi:hypothetical protein